MMSRYVVSKPKPHSDVGCSEGNYQAYIEDLKRRKGPDADQPHRIAYKKLVRV
jgi:energy-dependent translational throttle protein EttA